MTDEREDKNRKIGLAVSIGVHALVALLFIFIMAWRAPNPPHPEYGVVLNFGVDETGSGDVQPETPAEEAEEVEEVEEEVPESEPEETEVVEEEVTEPVEETEQPAVTTEQESPVHVPEVEEEVVEQPKEEVEEPAKQPVEKQQPEKQQEEERKVEAAFPAKEDANTTQSQGDKDESGDQGDPEGQLDERALYGNQGGGGGSSFSLEGWNWDYIPRPEDKSSENGRLVFEIKVNADGEIISVRTIERSVSPAVEKIYRSEVEKLTFSRKSSSGTAPPVSTGTITFVIKSK